ncbi:hypothetical protein BSY240_597 [Agrobacterium sp. RAC06]|nr:hypothetical protein BSY240_597 [Agrobacterium sp. RAC06]
MVFQKRRLSQNFRSVQRSRLQVLQIMEHTPHDSRIIEDECHMLNPSLLPFIRVVAQDALGVQWTPKASTNFVNFVLGHFSLESLEWR